MKIELRIYLDYNSTTPVDPEVLKEMLPYFTNKFGNSASRTHSFGWEAEEAVQIARERIAKLINCEPSEIIFTSGATESINLAIKGVYDKYKTKGNHIITISTEHKAVLDTCKVLSKLGADITYLPVNPDGIIDMEILKKNITDKTTLISIMLANNETGVIQPIAHLPICPLPIFLFCDATQAVGKISVDVKEMGIDLMAFSAHKMYGPKGIGALYIRRKNPRVSLTPLIDGGGHERGIRSGTLNVPGIVGFGKAAEVCNKKMKNEAEVLKNLRDHLEHSLLQLPNTYVNGNIENRMTHVLNISFGNIDSARLIASLNGIAVATGSACTSADSSPSHVLKAMGVTPEKIHSSIRFSLGRFTTKEEIDYVIEKVTNAIKKLSKKYITNSINN